MYWAIAIVLSYAAIGAVIGGYIHTVKKESEYNWGNDDSGFVAAGWPITLFWYFFLKPIFRVGKHLGTGYVAKVEQRKRIRIQLEDEKRKKEREVEQAMREMEAEEEQRHSEPAKQMRI
jgi:hypothetical protein